MAAAGALRGAAVDDDDRTAGPREHQRPVEPGGAPADHDDVDDLARQGVALESGHDWRSFPVWRRHQ